MKGSIDSFPRAGIPFLGRTNIFRSKLGPLGHHVQHKMGQDVSLVERFQKENSIAEFTEYLNSWLNLQNIWIVVFVYIKENYVFDSKQYASYTKSFERNKPYCILRVTVAFHLQKLHNKLHKLHYYIDCIINAK